MKGRIDQRILSQRRIGIWPLLFCNHSYYFKANTEEDERANTQDTCTHRLNAILPHFYDKKDQTQERDPAAQALDQRHQIKALFAQFDFKTTFNTEVAIKRLQAMFTKSFSMLKLYHIHRTSQYQTLKRPFATTKANLSDKVNLAEQRHVYDGREEG
ncbi:hypothetical protein NHQ30_009587 [Ciborinia camelliae]|nr:hypothetical protein NHQ30_009587 [Ciborinia camelliae]